jgi:hypothetical protein
MTTTTNTASAEPFAPRVVRDCTLPWVKIDTVVARDGDLDPTAKALYLALATFADKGTRATEADPNGFDVPTRKALAACIGMDVKTVDRATARLEAYRVNGLPLLTVERRKDPLRPKSHLPSVYHLLDHELWDARASERHAARESARNARKGGRTGAATPRDTHVPTPPGGGDTGVPTPRDTHVPTPRDTSVAVPFTTQKTTTTPRAEGVSEAASAAETGVGGSGVRQSEQNLGDLQGVLSGDAYQALTLDERSGLAALVAQLLGAGWTTAQIRSRRPDRRVNATTTHPHTHIRKALETLITESAPGATVAPKSAAGTAGAHQDRADVEELRNLRDDAVARAGRLLASCNDRVRTAAIHTLKKATMVELEAWEARPDNDIRREYGVDVEGDDEPEPSADEGRAKLAALVGAGDLWG